jgi:hypothetical protein
MWQIGSRSHPFLTRLRSRQRLLSGIAGCVAATAVVAATLSVALSAPARSQEYREAGSAPPHWTQFAKLVRYRFEDWMGADDDVGNRFRAYLREHRGKEDGPPQMLEVRAWLNPDGTVEKVTFPALNNAQADADLRKILTRGNVGEAPPPEMLQPLRLRLLLNLK